MNIKVDMYENYTFEIKVSSPRGQSIKKTADTNAQTVYNEKEVNTSNMKIKFQETSVHITDPWVEKTKWRSFLAGLYRTLVRYMSWDKRHLSKFSSCIYDEYRTSYTVAVELMVTEYSNLDFLSWHNFLHRDITEWRKALPTPMKSSKIEF